VSNKQIIAFINPNAFLLLCLIIMVFFVPVLSISYHQVTYTFLFSSIFILSALSLQHIRKKMLIAVVVFLIMIIWIAFRIDLPILFLTSRIAQGLFFVFIVVRLIKQTATSENVNVRVIADSINGYLLVGVVYAIIVYSTVRFHSQAFHFPEGDSNSDGGLMSKMFYYTFVTYTSTGYGDIIPMLPAARSLATLISATGQLYIAIIIALLVGKFSSLGTRT
jgi:hypothetical protein